MGNGIPCIICDKEIEPLDDHIRNGLPMSQMWKDGIVDSVGAGYGSCHDTTVFLIGLCDGCIKELIKKGKITEL